MSGLVGSRAGLKIRFRNSMLCLCAAQLKFWFQTELGRKNSASYFRQLFLLLTLLAMVTRWSSSTSNFYALICQNLTGELMLKIYAASWILLLWQLKLTEFCVNLWCFKLSFFHWIWTKWTSATTRSLLLVMASLFIGFLVEKYVTCQSRKSDFGWHCFRFSSCLMCKEGWKVWSDTGLLETFLDLHLEW